jgi:hypothetical protein
MNFPSLWGNVECNRVTIVQCVYGSGQTARARGGVGGYIYGSCAGNWREGHRSDEHKGVGSFHITSALAIGLILGM